MRCFAWNSNSWRCKKPLIAYILVSTCAIQKTIVHDTTSKLVPLRNEMYFKHMVAYFCHGIRDSYHDNFRELSTIAIKKENWK